MGLFDFGKRPKSALNRDRKYFNASQEHEKSYAKSFKRRKKTYSSYDGGGYVGKGELVWRKLSNSKKAEFLYENFTPQITPRGQELLVGKTYNFLPKNVKIALNSKYANVEEYDNGGGVDGDTIADRYARLTEREAKRLDELQNKVKINEQTESEDAEYDRLVHKYRGWDKMAKGGGVDSWSEEKVDKIYSYYLDELSSSERLKVESKKRTQKQKREFLKRRDEEFGKQFDNGGGVGSGWVIGDILKSKRDSYVTVIRTGKHEKGIDVFQSDKDGKAIEDEDGFGSTMHFWDYEWENWEKVGHRELEKVNKNGISYHKSGSTKLDIYRSLLDDRYQFFSKNAPKNIQSKFDRLENDNYHYTSAELVNDFFKHPTFKHIKNHKLVAEEGVLVSDYAKGGSITEYDLIEGEKYKYLHESNTTIKYLKKQGSSFIFTDKNGEWISINADELASSVAEIKPESKFRKSVVAIIRENLRNNEISVEILKRVLGREPDYPNEVVGSMKFEKCFLRPYYRIV